MFFFLCFVYISLKDVIVIVEGLSFYQIYQGLYFGVNMCMDVDKYRNKCKFVFRLYIVVRIVVFFGEVQNGWDVVVVG